MREALLFLWHIDTASGFQQYAKVPFTCRVQKVVSGPTFVLVAQKLYWQCYLVSHQTFIIEWLAV